MSESTVPEGRKLPTWIIVLSLIVLLAFLGLIGWGLKRSMSGPISIGQKVPEFQMTTFDGQTLRSTDFAGKVIVLNFWASWCKPCEQEARELEEAYQYYKDSGKVVFLGLAYVDTEYKSREYLKKVWYYLSERSGPQNSGFPNVPYSGGAGNLYY